MTRKPLEGVRIADFCWVGAGSYTTKILADHGADVIKIESRAKVDGIRLSPPFAGGESGVNRSGYFADRNTGKRSITIDMRTPRGQQVARKLVAVSDVVSNNFTPGVMGKFGLSYEDVREINPAAIFLAMSMQGSGGPDRDFVGYGSTISALVGLHHLSGIPGKLPVGTGTNYPDHIPNPGHAAFAVLAALRHTRRTGRGQYIDLAQTEATIAVLGPAILEYTVNGRDREPKGNQHDRFAPHGVYPCKGVDRWIAIAVKDDAGWRALVDVLGIADDDLESAWGKERTRQLAADELDTLVASYTLGHDAWQLSERLQAAGVPAGPVQDAADVVDWDPQLRARGHWLRLPHGVMGESIYNAPPFRLSRTPSEPDRAAPLLGEHTREVCEEVLGIPPSEIEELIESGVLR